MHPCRTTYSVWLNLGKPVGTLPLQLLQISKKPLETKTNYRTVFSIEKRVKQSCLLAPAFYRVHQWLNPCNKWFRYRHPSSVIVISALIYADDLILMGEKEQDLQKLLNSVQLTKAFCSLLLKQLLAELFVFATLNNSTLFSSRLLDDTYRVMNCMEHHAVRKWQHYMLNKSIHHHTLSQDWPSCIILALKLVYSQFLHAPHCHKC